MEGDRPRRATSSSEGENHAAFEDSFASPRAPGSHGGSSSSSQGRRLATSPLAVGGPRNVIQQQQTQLDPVVSSTTPSPMDFYPPFQPPAPSSQQTVIMAHPSSPPNMAAANSYQVIHVPVFRAKKRILVKRQTQGCLGFLNVCYLCDTPDGPCASLNFCGCLDREVTTKYYPDGRVKKRTHRPYLPCC